jgi:uncharacterized protein (TIGR02246 family)
MKHAFAVVAALVIAVAVSTAHAKSSEMNAGAQGVLEQFTRDWQAGDAHALAGLFARNADFVNPWGIWAKGRSEIETFYAGAFRSGFSGSNGEGHLVSVRAVRPDLALVDATWRITGAKMPDGKPRPDEQGILVGLMARTRHGWQIVALRENASATEIVPLANEH